VVEFSLFNFVSRDVFFAQKPAHVALAMGGGFYFDSSSTLGEANRRRVVVTFSTLDNLMKLITRVEQCGPCDKRQIKNNCEARGMSQGMPRKIPKTFTLFGAGIL
jgi:hypothetical protein